jgi:hypothetical protein
MSRGQPVFIRQRSLTARLHAQAIDVMVYFTGGWTDNAVPLVQHVVQKRAGETLTLAEAEYDQLEKMLAELIDQEGTDPDDV